MTEAKIRTCLDCVHVKHHPECPPCLTAWECTKEDVSNENWVEPESYVEFTDEEFALYCAKGCTDYKQKSQPVYDYLQTLPEDSVYRRNADLYLEDDNDNEINN